MRNRNRRWIFFWILMSSYHYVIICEVVEAIGIYTSRRHQDNSSSKDLRSIFSPRMDYEQWKPLGRGDPLKNDPTYDYVPPVLDRVHYWMDPSLRKPDPPVPSDQKKTEVLLLGITSKKPSTINSQVADSRRDTYDPFLQFVDGPKFHSHQKIPRPHYSSGSSYYSPSFYYSNKNRLTERNIYAKGNEQRVPYTMLVPPPVAPENTVSVQQSISQKPITLQQQLSTTVRTTPQTTSTSKTTATSQFPVKAETDVTVQESNLIYHSTSYSDGSEWKNKNNFATKAPFFGQSGWKSTTPFPYNSSTKKIRPEIIFQNHLSPPDTYIELNFADNNSNRLSQKPLIADGSSHNVNYVTPPPLIKSEGHEVMHKGQVTDDDLDESNTYVKIGKTEAQVHSSDIVLPNIPIISQSSLIRHPTVMMNRPMMMFPHMKHNMVHNDVISMPPLAVQTIENMQTMQPPPITKSPSYTKPQNHLLGALEREKTSTMSLGGGPGTLYITTTEATTIEEEDETTTAPPTTTVTSLTTDPLFRHYKQPEEPMRGPLYLIIQGHSKVKTYGPSKHIHGIAIQDTNDIGDDKDDGNNRIYEVRHLHYRKEPKMEKARAGRSGNLQTLKHVVETGFGAIDFTDIPADRNNDEDADVKVGKDVKETELKAGYEVAEAKDVTSEKYHKGIVEEARKLKDFEKGNATVSL